VQLTILNDIINQQQNKGKTNMTFKPFKHELCIPDTWSVLNTLKTPSMGKDHFEAMFEGDAQLNLMNLFREVCDAISQEMGYEFGMNASLVVRNKNVTKYLDYVKLDTVEPQVFFVFNQNLDIAADPALERKGVCARRATHIFGTAQTKEGNEKYYNSFPELVVKTRKKTLGDGAVLKKTVKYYSESYKKDYPNFKLMNACT